MRKKRGTKVTDFEDIDALRKETDELEADFADWQSSDVQGTHQLWRVLGRIYELGHRLEENQTAKSNLVAKVATDSNVRNNPRWDPSTKASHELLLVKLLSLQENTKAKKSQWLSAIRAAKKSNIPYSQGDFVKFLEQIGGVDKARQSALKIPKTKPTFETLAKECLLALDAQAPEFTVPNPLMDETFLNGVAVVLVSGTSTKDGMRPVAAITTKAVVERAISAFLRSLQVAEREQWAEIQQGWRAIALNQRRRLRKLYVEWKKTPAGKKYRLEFEEFVEEKMIEDSELEELAPEIPDLEKRIIDGSRYRS
ncbi:hypothetical protein [Sphingobium sp. B11D3A]|uniref:hypothetical protein n=1 Tax=Sphingobium sp. B11D3A TaxID=2940574 RepID=UPI0022246D1F|nr:hypothetical protein [Sphingobium sp. B11D3A]MCW2392270.1 hypothetical protein [Sphingobium sp. B11D3A]